ncbi:hypothetical protein GH733_007270 [Mirounga leonina]|nr:hypothetical protein GH733_007270 [Mirounga leonina]
MSSEGKQGDLGLDLVLPLGLSCFSWPAPTAARPQVLAEAPQFWWGDKLHQCSIPLPSYFTEYSEMIPEKISKGIPQLASYGKDNIPTGSNNGSRDLEDTKVKPLER